MWFTTLGFDLSESCYVIFQKEMVGIVLNLTEKKMKMNLVLMMQICQTRKMKMMMMSLQIVILT